MVLRVPMRTHRGFSLIELLLVLSIVAALAVAAFIIFPRVQAGKLAQQYGWSAEERACRAQTNNMDPGKACEINGQAFKPHVASIKPTASNGRAFTTGEDTQGGF